MNTNQQTVHQMGFGINEMVKQATGRESVSNIDMDWVSVEQLARYIYGSGSGDVVSFDTNIPDAIVSLIAYITAAQDLHGYDNPWPGGAGKNKIDKSLFTYGYHIDSNTYLPTAFPGRICTLNPIIVSGDSMIISYHNLVSSESDLGIIYSVFNGDTKKRRGVEKNQDIVIDISDGDRVYISMFKTVAGTNTSQNISLDDFDNLQLEYGSTKTDFSPYSNICPITGWTGCTVTNANMLDSSDPDYHADIYSFTFSDEAGTVYGGELDVLTGVLTVNTKMLSNINFSAAIVSASSNGCTQGRIANILSDNDASKAADSICDTFKYASSGDFARFAIASGTIYFVLPQELTATEWKSVMNTLNPSIMYYLAEPVTFQLTAQEVTALVGENNIFADTGNVSVQYKVKEDLV